VVFVLFTVAILTFQYQREKRYRIAQLENTLDNITEITHRFIGNNKLLEDDRISRISELEEIIPQPNMRITVISHGGEILFDSSVDDFLHMGNHLNRPEIRQAMQEAKGANIRLSGTTGEKYYYYAKKYPGYFIRTAVVYNIQIRNFLRAEWAFLFFILAAFLIIGFILYYVTGKLSDAITKLKDFSIQAGRDQVMESGARFPENELGVIGSQIIQIYHDLKKAKDELLAEKEKLLNHLNALNEGIAFFSPEKQKTLSNRHFIQFVQIISGKTVQSADDILHYRILKNLKASLTSTYPVICLKNRMFCPRLNLFSFRVKNILKFKASFSRTGVLRWLSQI
jgi:two-component system, OmpR family, phosphate regulon sensor histidine kinase PhoR